MPHFHRYYIANALMFITTIVYDRQPIFADTRNVDLLFTVMRQVQGIHHFHLLAYVIMPDHLHFLMQLDVTPNFSQIMQSIKWNYTREYKRANDVTSSLVLWQRRFWDHIIRDEDDLARHVDYIPDAATFPIVLGVSLGTALVIEWLWRRGWRRKLGLVLVMIPYYAVNWLFGEVMLAFANYDTVGPGCARSWRDGNQSHSL